MPFDLNLPLLAAEAGTAEKALLFLGALLGVIVLPFVLGSVIAKSVKMRDYGWKIGLTLCTLACALFILSRSFDWETKKFKIPLGVDLKGGVILIYEVENTAVMSEKGAQDSEDSINMGDLVQALTNRINPSGTKEIVIRPYGDRQVEIIIPEVDPIEVERIKRLIDTAGALEFRIVANQRDHQYLLAAAEAQSEDQARKLSRRVLVDGKPAGFWARAAKEKLSMAEVSDNILRNARTGAMIDIRQLPPMRDGEQLLQDFLEANELDDMDVLVATDDGVNVSGDNLGTVSAGNDELLNPCVRFRMKGEGVQKFRYLTSENLPSTDSTPAFYRHLGIILDERLLTFPRILTTISDNGQITGNFTQEEVDFLVGILRSGRLPATLQKVPDQREPDWFDVGRRYDHQREAGDWDFACCRLVLCTGLLPILGLRGLPGVVDQPAADPGVDGDAECSLDSAGVGRFGADRRYVGGRQRADLRAYSGRAGPGCRAAHGNTQRFFQGDHHHCRRQLDNVDYGDRAVCDWY